ncbi:amidohydrolase, partial [candidate division KSB1 bacterium]|nr:amidohydrolase [candidate division KSB1 bacterium]
MPSLLIVLIIATPIWSQKIAVKGETVYTMAGDPIQNGVVLIKNGKIERVGPAS